MNLKPIIFLAFANDEAKYLRHLSTEAQRLRQTLSMAKQHGLCDFEERFNISVRDIFQAVKMSEISIFHYAGHADDQTMSLSQPNSENIWIDTYYLNDFLARNKAIKVIFLNACSSRAQAEALIAKGIPIVIGTSTEISDSIATQLAASFYESLISGHTVGEAWKDATDEILANNSSEKDVWKKVESITEEETRGRVDKKGMKIRVPWKMYYTDEKNLEWKLEKLANKNYNVEIETGKLSELVRKTENTMNPEKKNESQISGSGNFVFQDLKDVNNLTVNIHTGNTQIPNNQSSNMSKSTILELIEQGDVVQVFNELDKTGLKDFQYSRFKREFSAGLKGADLLDFIDRLKVYLSTKL